MNTSDMTNWMNSSGRTPMLSQTTVDDLIGSADRFVCFDFDCTLTTSHWFRFLNNYENSWHGSYGGFRNKLGEELDKEDHKDQDPEIYKNLEANLVPIDDIVLEEGGLKENGKKNN